MMVRTFYTIKCPPCLPGPGKASPMMWELVPQEIKTVLLQEGCLLLKHWMRRHHATYVRFQYAPLVYKGDLFYLQRWALVEWNVVPSQLIFPREGWPCSENTRRKGSLLSLQIRLAIANLYPENQRRNHFPKNWVHFTI